MWCNHRMHLKTVLQMWCKPAPSLIYWQESAKGSGLCLIMIFMRERYMLYTLLGFSRWLLDEFDCDLYGSWDLLAPYENKLVVTRVGIWCIWFVSTAASGATLPWPWLIQIKYITPTLVKLLFSLQYFSRVLLISACVKMRALNEDVNSSRVETISLAHTWNQHVTEHCTFFTCLSFIHVRYVEEFANTVSGDLQ